MKTIKFPGIVPLAALTVLLWVPLATVHGARFTVKGGDGAYGGGGGLGAGGAIYVRDGTLTVGYCTFERNGAFGGNGSIAIYNEAGGGGGLAGNGGATVDDLLTGGGGGGGARG